MISINRQDIVQIDLGSVANISGHEQANPRPCIVIQVVKSFGLAVIIPLTTKELSHFAVVPLFKGVGGLKKDSFAMCHQIRTVSISRTQFSIGKLPDRDFNKVLAVLVDFLDL